MNIWHDISEERIKSNSLVAVIEIKKGGKNKYELDKETGMLKLDRVLYTATHYPANYGFIPRTYAEDNDPLDVMVMLAQKISKLPSARVIGTGTMLDSARLRTILARQLSVSTQSINAYVLGEHGDSSMINWSSASIGGIDLNSF